MARVFDAEIVHFSGETQQSALDLATAAEFLMSGKVPVILLSIVGDEGPDAWWNDPGFPEPEGEHDHHKGVVTSAKQFTMGQLQRASAEDFLQRSASYFLYAASANKSMKETRFIRFFMEELGAAPLTLENGVEFVAATKRLYPAYTRSRFSFDPHCDCISFVREPAVWPFKSDPEQIGAWLLLQQSSNNAGFIVWEKRARSRKEFDQWSSEMKETGKIGELENARSVRVQPRAGQLVFFNSRNLHGIESCASNRHTIGTFLIQHNGRWALFD